MKKKTKPWFALLAIILTLLFYWLINRELNRHCVMISGYDIGPFLFILAIWLSYPLILLISLYKHSRRKTLIIVWSITTLVYLFLPVKWELGYLTNISTHTQRTQLIEMLDDPSIGYEKIIQQSQRADVELILLQYEALFRQRVDVVDELVECGYPIEKLNLHIYDFLKRFYNSKASLISKGNIHFEELPALPSCSAYNAVKLMIDYGIDINERGADGGNGLISALWADDELTIYLLLYKGIELVQCEGDNCPITAAICNDNIEMAQKLLAAGLDINFDDSFNGTPLYRYIHHHRNGRPISSTTVEFMLANGAASRCDE